MKSYIRILTIVILSLTIAPSVYAVDIYIVYSGSDKKIQKKLKKSLSSSVKVKSYNVDLLAVADYSGKQKVITKLLKAKLVVFVKEKPKEILGDANFSSAMSVSDASEAKAVLAKFKNTDGSSIQNFDVQYTDLRSNPLLTGI